MNNSVSEAERTQLCDGPAFKWHLFKVNRSITTSIEQLFRKFDVVLVKLSSTPNRLRNIQQLYQMPYKYPEQRP